MDEKTYETIGYDAKRLEEEKVVDFPVMHISKWFVLKRALVTGGDYLAIALALFSVGFFVSSELQFLVSVISGVFLMSFISYYRNLRRIWL